MEGYLCTVHIRDPGVYTLQVRWSCALSVDVWPQLLLCRWPHLQIGVSWYFGNSEIGDASAPAGVVVGSHMSSQYNELDFRRSLIDGTPAQVALRAAVPDKKTPQFGSKKCTKGDSKGRWLNMAGKPCEPPLCTGDRAGARREGLWVSSCCQSVMT